MPLLERLNAKHILIVAFCSIIGMLTLMMYIGTRILNSSVDSLNQVVHSSHEKSRLAYNIKLYARDRTVNLYRMTVTDDPFERDAIWLEFLKSGTDFFVNYQKLQEITKTPEEKALLEKLKISMNRVAPSQDKVTSLLVAGKDRQAKELLANETTPLQIISQKALTDIINLQEKISHDTVQNEKLKHQQVQNLLLVLAAIVVLLCLLFIPAVIRRITHIEKHLKRQKDLAQVTLYSIGDGIITVDHKGKIIKANTAAEKILRIKSDETRDKHIRKVITLAFEHDRGEIDTPISTCIETSTCVQSAPDSIAIRKDGSEISVEYTVSPIFDIEKKTQGAILVIRDVTESRLLSRQIAHQATHDHLTGLYNRSEFEKILNDALVNSRDHTETEHWLCFLDLDQFKIVNDTCGHQAGDELLKQISGIILNNIRATDQLARMGGDEFAILLYQCNQPSAQFIAEKIRTALEDLKFVWNNHSFNSSASIGLIPVNSESGSVSRLLSNADTACYFAKDKGRNRIYVYNEDDKDIDKHSGEISWAHRLTNALSNDEFVLYYQDIVPLAKKSGDNTFLSELLIRLKDADNNIIPPMAFIPSAERFNMMSKIDRWVIKTAISLIATYLPKPTGHQRRIFSINLSGQSLSDKDLGEYIQLQLELHDVPAELICFEITETCAITNLSRATRLITLLKKMGCKFSLDDFGSGLSSFNYLKNLPVDYLKIDGAFIRNIEHDKMDMEFVKSINQIGHTLGVETIAEFIENQHTIEVLENLGVDYGQGYHIMEPQPFENLFSASVIPIRSNL